jgi:hypothetical protein
MYASNGLGGYLSQHVLLSVKDYKAKERRYDEKFMKAWTEIVKKLMGNVKPLKFCIIVI